MTASPSHTEEPGNPVRRQTLDTRARDSGVPCLPMPPVLNGREAESLNVVFHFLEFSASLVPPTPSWCFLKEPAAVSGLCSRAARLSMTENQRSLFCAAALRFHPLFQ